MSLTGNLSLTRSQAPHSRFFLGGGNKLRHEKAPHTSLCKGQNVTDSAQAKTIIFPTAKQTRQ
jgi:hypothetical protein